MASARTMGIRGQRGVLGEQAERPVSKALIDALNNDCEAYPVVAPVPYHGDMYQAVPSHSSTDVCFCMVMRDERAAAEPFRTFVSSLLGQVNQPKPPNPKPS